MKRELGSVYRHPLTGEPLALRDEGLAGDDVVTGNLVSATGDSFVIADGLPELVWPPLLSGPDKHAREFYDGRADVYDRYLPLTFATYREDEGEIRHAMVDRLELKPGQRVLEVGAGTGRDSEIIASRLGDA